MDHDRSSIIQLIENPWIKFIPFWISQRSKTIISIIVRSVIIIIGYYWLLLSILTFLSSPSLPPFPHTRKSLAYYFNVLVFRDNNSGASPSSTEILCKAP